MKIKVNISDAKISSNPQDTLITYALGSCIGVSLYDPNAGIGGMLHCLLPDSHENASKAQQNPFKYVDSGLALLLAKIRALGANKRRLQVVIAGCAQKAKREEDVFNIGKRNYFAIRKNLWKAGLFIKAEDVGGHQPRTMYLNLADGSVTIKSGLQEKTLLSASLSTTLKTKIVKAPILNY